MQMLNACSVFTQPLLQHSASGGEAGVIPKSLRETEGS